MRVGANARQYAQIKKHLKDGVPQHIISKMLRIEPQSLEKIIANLEGREEKILELEENPKVQAMSAENEDLRAKLAAYEGDKGEEDEDED